MSALKVVRDGHVLRVTLAKPERRNAFDAALIAELTEAFADVGDARAVLLEGEGPRFCAGADVEWQRAAIDLSYDENVEDAMRLYRMLETIDSCPAPGGLLRARLRARRRLRARGVRRHRGCVARRGLRVHRGAARDHPGGHLAVRSREDRQRRSALLRHGRAVRPARSRSGSGSCPEVSEDAGERAEQIVRDILAGGPIAVREAKRLVRRAADRHRHGPHRRRTPHERGGTGRPPSVPRPAPGRLARRRGLVAPLVEVLPEPEERENERREQRREPHDHRRSDPRPRRRGSTARR